MLRHLRQASCMHSTMHLIQYAQNLRTNNKFFSALHFLFFCSVV
jgi:hypothetical protein